MPSHYLLTSYKVLAANNRVRLRVEVFPTDGVQPEHALGFFHRDPVKGYPCFSGHLAISRCTVVCTARIHHAQLLIKKTTSKTNSTNGIYKQRLPLLNVLAIRKLLRNTCDVTYKRSNSVVSGCTCVVWMYIDILTIIINYPYCTCISSFLAAASLLLCSFFFFFGLYIIMIAFPSLFTVATIANCRRCLKYKFNVY